MIQPRAVWSLPTRRIGRRVLLFGSLDSTNNYAASLAHDAANDGLVVMADNQSAGRGQYGRQWQSLPGQGILLSALLFPPPELRRPVVLAAWATVAVCDTVERLTGLEPRIKWPNDVFVSGRKVCGILIEQGRGTVAGIGLNVNQSAAAFAAAGLPEAGSLASLTATTFDVAAAARLLVEELDRRYCQLLEGATAAVEAIWQRRLGLTGRPVAVETTTATYCGELRTLTFEQIAVKTAAGETVRPSPESVRQLRGPT